MVPAGALLCWQNWLRAGRLPSCVLTPGRGATQTAHSSSASTADATARAICQCGASFFSPEKALPEQLSYQFLG